MSRLAVQLARERDTRDAAKAALDLHLSQVREDFAARGIAGRIADSIFDQAADMAYEAAYIASTHKRTIVAGTVLAVIAWILHRPVFDWIDDHLPKIHSDK